MILALIMAVLSGALSALAASLHPIWWAAWLAPIPLLWAASRIRRGARWLGFLAGAIGGLGVAQYYIEVAGPVPAGMIILLQALASAFLVSVYQRAMAKGKPAQAVWLIALLKAGLDVLVATVSPHGTSGSLAYSQMEFLPALQMASLGGTAAVSFVVTLFGAAVAVILARSAKAALIPLALVAASLGWGAWRIDAAAAPATTPVGLVASDAYEGAPKDWDQVWSIYRPGIERAIGEGAKLVLLPEKIVRLTHAQAKDTAATLSELSRSQAVEILMGVLIDDAAGQANRAIWAGSDGSVAIYDKQHLVPGWEGKITPGPRQALIRQTSAGPVGAAICKDMDFSQLGRDYAGAALMLVPGWDFRGDWGADGYAHGRLAILRGVENGYTVARSPRVGQLVVSDRFGRVVAETPSRVDTAVLVAQAPIPNGDPTLYARIGDLFGWLCVVLGTVGFVRLRVAR
jgi:apolipoprotein N-acyltransferase